MAESLKSARFSRGSNADTCWTPSFTHLHHPFGRVVQPSGRSGGRATRKRRTRTEKKNTGQEPEQKRQNTGVRVLPVAQCAAADGRRATGDARWANTNDPPEGSWGVGQLDTSYRVYYHQSYTISTTEEARDQVTPFVSSIQCPIEGGEFEQKETIILPSKAHIGSASRSSTDLT